MPRFWQLEGCRSGLCENRTGAAPHHTQFQLASAQGTAQPHSHNSGSSRKVYLGKVKGAVQQLCEREKRKCERTSAADTQARKAGGRGASSARSDSLQSKTMMMQIVLLQPMDDLPLQKTAVP